MSLRLAPLDRALRRPSFSGADWPATLRSGILSGLLAAVSTLSYASVAGAPLGASVGAMALVSGGIGAVLGAAVACLFGAVPGQLFAPRASVAVVIASAAQSFATAHAGAADPLASALASLTVCLLLASLLQLGFAALRVGGLIRLIPQSVSAGLTIALAIQLLWSQWPRFIGPAPFIGAAGYATVATGLASLAALGWARFRWQSPHAVLIGLATGIAIAAVPLVLPSVQAIAPLAAQGRLPALDMSLGAGLTPLLLPLPRWAEVAGHLAPAGFPSLFAFALVLALVNSMETLTSALVLEDAQGKRFNANRALLAGALGSLAAAVAGGLPVGGGAGASVAHLRNGGRRRASGLVAAAVVAWLFLGGGRYFDAVPLAAVAAVMTTVAFALVAAPAAELLRHWRRRREAPRRVGGELAVTALVTLLFLSTDLLMAIAGGLATASVLAMVDMRAGLLRRRYDATDASLPEALRAQIPPAVGRSIQVLELGQPLFFATAEAALQLIERRTAGVRCTVLDLRHVGIPDATAARALVRCSEASGPLHRLVVVCAPADRAAAEALTGCRVIDDLHVALRRCTVDVLHADNDAATVVHAVPPAAGNAVPAAVPAGGPVAPAAVRPFEAARSGAQIIELAAVAAPQPAPAAKHAGAAPAASRLVSAITRPTLSVVQAARVAFVTPSPAIRHVPIPEEAVDDAARALAVHIGPIAPVLVRRARHECRTLADFHQRVAGHVDDPAARALLLVSLKPPRGVLR